jgi:hypothetical protein
MSKVKKGGNVDSMTMDFTDTNTAMKSAGTNNPAEVIATPSDSKAGEIVFNTAVEQAPEVPRVLEAQAKKDRNLEEFSENGKKVYAVDKDVENSQYIFYDRDGNELDDNTVEILNQSYGKPPETDGDGGHKVGPFFVREVDDNNQTPVDANYSGKSTFMAERQNYSSGNAWTKTIPIRFYDVVRVLRGEIGNTKKEEE